MLETIYSWVGDSYMLILKINVVNFMFVVLCGFCGEKVNVMIHDCGCVGSDIFIQLTKRKQLFTQKPT